MSATDIAAWWGAAIASLVLAWDVFKWTHQGPAIRVSASPNMETNGAARVGMDDGKFVIVEVVNTGDRKTTITHLFGVHYTNLWRKIRKKQSTTFVVPDPGLQGHLPFVLEPGERWLGAIEQNDDLECMSREGLLYCGIYHSGGRRAVVDRVVVPKVNAT